MYLFYGVSISIHKQHSHRFTHNNTNNSNTNNRVPLSRLQRSWATEVLSEAVVPAPQMIYDGRAQCARQFSAG